MKPTIATVGELSRTFRVIGVALVFSFLGFPSLIQASEPTDDRHFNQSIAPILVQRCLECHGGTSPKGRLDLSTSANARKGGKGGPALVPGEPGKSLLWERIDADEMPPRKPLLAREKQLLREWIAKGAVWGSEPLDPFRITSEQRAGYDWWALQPVKRPTPPTTKGTGRTPVDAFALAKLEAKGWSLSAEADRRTLIRRLTFDLLGLPPTPAEVEAFVRDADPHAYDKLVDRLLASPHYGERWARHWLDIVRFGESHGYEHDELRRNAWPYRDWVIDAFNRDLPYDEFARLQIAGDVLQPNDPAGVSATGFLVAGGFDSVGQRQQSQAMRAVVRQEELEDILGTFGQTFLGLTIQCARCHDHKFDPVRQDDYFRLAASFAGVRHGERDITSSAEQTQFQQLLAERQAHLNRLRELLAKLEQPVRQRILQQRKQDQPPLTVMPLARWDFTKGLDDQVGSLHAQTFGDAKQTEAGLVLAGKGHAATKPLSRLLKARTFAVWVKLANLEQRGGGVLTVQSLNGSTFDSLVFGEKDPGQWLAGSNFYQRTQSFQGPVEKDASTRVVLLALVYRDDGTILAYREGQPYGQPYRSSGPLTFEAGAAQILFGLRHGPAGGSKHLVGTIVRAELFDTPLSPADVARLANSVFVSDDDILAGLDEPGRQERAKLLQTIDGLRKQIAAPAKRLVYAVAPQPPEPTHLLLRGEPGRKGPIQPPGAVAALGRFDFALPETSSDAERRKRLAEWLTDRRNPLFARVLVNRVWQYHFGVGLVDTPSDFGFNGGRPTHPELLDWLADEFIQQGSSLKKLHRLLVTSAVYRQASKYRAEPGGLDAGNRWLWRKSPFRLEAEAVRDAILHVAGQLNPAVGGPGYQDFDITVRGATHYYNAVDRDEPDARRRSIYRTWARSGRNRLLDTLDCPDPSTVAPRRALTTTPLQALSLLNNSFLLRMADRFAERIERDAGSDRTKQIQRAYGLAFGREASALEVARALPVIEQHGLSAFCRVVFNSNEFLYVD